MAEAGSILGNPVVRLEDPALLTGAAKYVDDLDSAGAARIVVVRSPVAHGPLVGADVVAEVEMVSQRLAGVPMEPNGCLMVPGEPAGGITCWISHQAPHSAQPAFVAVLGLDPGAVRVVCPWVGGGFGPKAAVY